MRQPLGSPAYWKSMVQWSISEIRQGSEDPTELMALIYMATLRLKEWETFLGQKSKRRGKGKAAKAARKINRRR